PCREGKGFNLQSALSGRVTHPPGRVYGRVKSHKSLVKSGVRTTGRLKYPQCHPRPVTPAAFGTDARTYARMHGRKQPRGEKSYGVTVTSYVSKPRWGKENFRLASNQRGLAFPLRTKSLWF